ncbi:glycosyltransferase family 4 protein [Thiohalobacter sp. IOR34]|uniref:MraY family glycosyltransferase n=1 Tax=Thiohalobacter sp. IOR34 TaxID=3057176 RepID=UPI0025B1945D|nr:glycosyltransferase family 4 protein [Thiohalobacter sp. IOR34]WJW76717.1 glycosyltransferase family 4 protein [Thiohalobacter sp. IOR34]
MLASLLAFVISAALAWWLAHPRAPLRILDVPNARSLHSRPIPRTGGLAIVAGLLAGGVSLLAGGVSLLGIGLPWVAGIHALDVDGHRALPSLAALAVLVVLSFIDDRRHIPALWRLPVQLGVAAVLVWQLLPASVGLLGFGLAVLFLGWMINLYNFMDGMDGFAGGMAVIGFGTLATLAWQQQAWLPAFGCSLVVAASLGFLTQNLPPARLFMGDTGSTLLGALAGVALLGFDRLGLLPLPLGLLLFSPFVVDASVTLLRRLLRGERVWEAHRSHYYQRLVRLGWGHGRTLAAEYLLMLAAAASVLWAARLPAAAQWSIIGGWGWLYLGLMAWISRLERGREG